MKRQILSNLIEVSPNHWINSVPSRFKTYDDLVKENEKMTVVTATYSLIDYGTGIRCAWCRELVSKIKNLDKHLKNHLKKEVS